MEENVSEQTSKVPQGFEIKEAKKTFSQRKVIKNLAVICVGFVLLFTAYNGLSMLQSTMNQQQGIGVASQAIIYAGFCISALLLPKYTLQKLGCKRTLLISMSCYIPYIAANFYFNWLTMVPSAILVGLAASLLWTSQCTYYNESSSVYSILTMANNHGIEKCPKTDINLIKCNITGHEKDDKNGHVEKVETLDVRILQNGAVSTPRSETACFNNDCKPKSIGGAKRKEVYQINVCDEYPLDTDISKDSVNSHIALENRKTTQKAKVSISEEYSKLVSSTTAMFFGLFGLALRTSDIWSNLMSYYVLHENNILDNITESDNCVCGASFCNVESNCFEHNLAEPSQETRNILTGVSVMLSVLAIVLVFLFLDELETDKKPVSFSFSLAMATCKFVKKKEALYLLPLSSYIGLQQAFYIGDFTKSYIACAWGVYHVGLVTVCYGAAAGISSTLAGFLVKYVGRISVMLLGAFANVAINIYLLIWNPLPGQSTQFFASAAMWGIAVGILWSQLRAFYGVIFKKDEEAAFAGFYLWDSIGYCVAFSYSNFICTYLKIYILLAVSTVGIIGYLKTELVHMQWTRTEQKMES